VYSTFSWNFFTLLPSVYTLTKSYSPRKNKTSFLQCSRNLKKLERPGGLRPFLRSGFKKYHIFKGHGATRLQKLTKKIPIFHYKHNNKKKKKKKKKNFCLGLKNTTFPKLALPTWSQKKKRKQGKKFQSFWEKNSGFESGTFKIFRLVTWPFCQRFANTFLSHCPILKTL